MIAHYKYVMLGCMMACFFVINGMEQAFFKFIEQGKVEDVRALARSGKITAETLLEGYTKAGELKNFVRLKRDEKTAGSEEWRSLEAQYQMYKKIEHCLGNISQKSLQGPLPLVSSSNFNAPASVSTSSSSSSSATSTFNPSENTISQMVHIVADGQAFATAAAQSSDLSQPVSAPSRLPVIQEASEEKRENSDSCGATIRGSSSSVSSVSAQTLKQSVVISAERHNRCDGCWMLLLAFFMTFLPQQQCG